MRRSLFRRFACALLIAALTLPSPACALRPSNAGMEESPVGRELRDAFDTSADWRDQLIGFMILYSQRLANDLLDPNCSLSFSATADHLLQNEFLAELEQIVPRSGSWILGDVAYLYWGERAPQYPPLPDKQKILLALAPRLFQRLQIRRQSHSPLSDSEILKGLQNELPDAEKTELMEKLGGSGVLEFIRRAKEIVDLASRNQRPRFAPRSSAGLEEEQEERLLDWLRSLIKEESPGVGQWLTVEKLRALRETKTRKAIERILRQGPLRKGEMGRIVKAVIRFQEMLDPHSPRFDIGKWFAGPFTQVANELRDEVERVPLTGKEFLEWVETYVQIIEPAFRLTGPVNPDEPVNRYDMESLYTDVRDQILLPRGFFYDTSEGKVFLGSVDPAFEILSTPAWREVRLYVVDYRGNQFPVGSAGSDHIFLAKEAVELLKRERRHANLKVRWNAYQQVKDTLGFLPEGWVHWWWSNAFPSQAPPPLPLESYPDLAREFLFTWAAMHAFGSMDLPAALRRYREDLVMEEAIHSDSTAFAQALKGRRLTSEPSDSVWKVEQILRKEGVLFQGLAALKEEPAQRQAEEAKAIIEVEARVLALVYVPDPAREFLGYFDENLWPEPEGREIPDIYLRAHERIRFFFSERLWGRQLTDAEWRRHLLEEIIDIDRFNQRLREAAREIYEREFLTLEERTKIRPLPWARSTAGLEEPLERFPRLRFQSADERPGVHGFLLEGEGLPFTLLFAQAAAQGFSVPFAGVATSDEIEDLVSRVDERAAGEIQERLVNIDLFGSVEEARETAKDLLRHQIPLDDRESLVIARVTTLWGDPVAQLQGYLYLLGLRFAGLEEQERALELLRAT